MKQDKKLKVYTMSLMSKLNDDHLLDRVLHYISKIDKNTISGGTAMNSKTIYNKVHINENGFYFVKNGRRYIHLRVDVIQHHLVVVGCLHKYILNMDT
jgi:hypothetical protein